MRRPALSYANVMSTLGVFIALGGTSYAVTKLPKNSVGSDQLRIGAVTNGKVADGAITATKLAPGTAITGPRGPRGEQGPLGAVPPIENWHNLDFVDGWSNYGAGFQTADYRKDANSIVTLRGLVARTGEAAPAGNGSIAQLPAGYRPALRRVFIVHTGEPHTFGRVDVLNNGAVVWMSGQAAATDYTSLEGISFDAAG